MPIGCSSVPGIAAAGPIRRSSSRSSRANVCSSSSARCSTRACTSPAARSGVTGSNPS